MRHHPYASGLLIMIACTACADSAFAQSAEFGQRDAGLELLKRRMQELDSAPMPARPPGPVFQMDGSLRNTWSALRVGMSETDVNMLLGAPDRVEGGGAEPNRWIWGKPGTKGGWVAFDPGARTVKEWRTF